MPTLLSIDFSPWVSTPVLILMAYSSISCLLIGGRISEIAAYCFGILANPSERNINKVSELNHRANLTLTPILYTCPLKPGMGLFIIGAYNLIIAPAHPLAALRVHDSALITFYLIMTINILIPLFLSPIKLSFFQSRQSLATIIDYLFLPIVTVHIYLSGPSFEQFLSIITLSWFARSFTQVITISIGIYGFFSPIFIPFAIAAYGMKTISLSLLAPIILLLPKIINSKPAKKSLRPSQLNCAWDSAICLQRPM